MPNPNSYQLPQEFLIVGAAVQVGLFAAVKNKPCSLEELAAETNSDVRALWTVVEALKALGYLQDQGEKITLTDDAENIFYNQDHEEYRGFSFMHTYNLIKCWIELPEVLQSGMPVPKKDSGHTKHFIKAMSYVAQKSAAQIVEYCLRDLPNNPKVLDVGGGPLTYAIAFVNKGASVTVLDLPEVIDMMQPELDPSLPIQMVKGDFTQGLPTRELYDLVYLGNVCHIYGEQENRKLFRDAAARLKTGGQVVINDMIRGTGVMPAIFAVNMLINTQSGGTWTFDQYQSWLADAGLIADRWEEVGGRQLIKATKQ